MTEKEKFLAWYRDQVENHGLIEVRVTIDHKATEYKEEEFYMELNEINKQIDDGNRTEITEL